MSDDENIPVTPGEAVRQHADAWYGGRTEVVQAYYQRHARWAAEQTTEQLVKRRDGTWFPFELLRRRALLDELARRNIT